MGRGRTLQILLALPLILGACVSNAEDTAAPEIRREVESSSATGPAAPSSHEPVLTSPGPTEAPPVSGSADTEPLSIVEAIAAGYVARCDEGNFSDNTDFDATCSGGGGIDFWLAPYGECGDGHVVAMSEDADCGGHDGFKGLLPADYRPASDPGDVALCENGTYSDNTDFADTCSANGGVSEWLATFGECGDGTVIIMSGDASCSGHGGFGRLLPADFQPAPRPQDIARCNNGLYSDNIDLDATCSANGGVAEWLATYGRCDDGTVIVMGEQDCDDHDGFAELMPADYIPATTTTTTTTTAPPTTSAPTPVLPVTPTSTAPAAGPLALDVLMFIPIALEHQDGYDRDRFHAWIDADGDGCNTRAEVLIAESLTFAQVDPSGCGVVAGDWYSAYDGGLFTSPGDVEIDHVVALKEAWDSGAWQWTEEQQTALGNDLTDPRTLIAVSSGANQSKGDRDPSNWLPVEADVCRFIGDWVAIKARWSLAMDRSEWGRIKNLLEGQCAGWTIAAWDAAPVVLPPPVPPATTLPPAATAPPAPPLPIVPAASLPPANCNPNYSGCVPNDSDVDCAGGGGNGPSYVRGPLQVIGSDVYGLDGDKDGIACE